MYIEARIAGLTPEQFWDLTPCELWREIDAVRQGKEERRDLLIEHAWHVVRIYAETRSKERLPSLESQLRKTPIRAARVSTQTKAPGQPNQPHVMHHLFREHGFAVRSISPEAKKALEQAH